MPFAATAVACRVHLGKAKPKTWQFIRPISNTKVRRTQASVWYHGWSHLKCSQFANLTQYHRNLYCPTCANNHILPLPVKDMRERPTKPKTINLAALVATPPKDTNTNSQKPLINQYYSLAFIKLSRQPITNKEFNFSPFKLQRDLSESTQKLQHLCANTKYTIRKNRTPR